MGQSSSSPWFCCGFSAPRTVDCHSTAAGGGKSPPPPDQTLSLLDECLAYIFALLPSNDRNSCSLVCKRWNSVDSRFRQRLQLTVRSDISAVLPSILSRFPAVCSLSVDCSGSYASSIDDNVLSLIASRLVSLRELKLRFCHRVSDEGLQAFSLNCPPLLSNVSLICCNFGATAIISLLRNCPSIRDLTLHAQPTRRIAAVDVAETNPKFQIQLERLCIMSSNHIESVFTPLLISVKSSLKTLIVQGSAGGNWNTIMEDLHSHGDGTTAITQIRMDHVEIGDSGLAAISKSCPRLEDLYLIGTSENSDQGIGAIASSCRNLRKIYINSWCLSGPELSSRSIGDIGMSIIGSKALQLTDLALVHVPIKVSFLNLLATNCSSIETMYLCNTETGDPEMKVIGERLVALKKLSIQICPISVEGVAAVVLGCPNLVTLELDLKLCREIRHDSNLRLLRGGLVISVVPHFGY